MKSVDLSKLSVDRLLERFIELGLAEDAARDQDNLKLYNRLYAEVEAVDKELRSRGREARLILTRLYDHPNIQVRLQAAQFSYGVAPEAARRCLQAIADSKIPPQYLDAGMSLGLLDEGLSKLD